MGQLTSPTLKDGNDAAATATREPVADRSQLGHELISVSTYGPLIVEHYRKPDGRRLTMYRRSPPA